MPNARIDFPQKTDLHTLFEFAIELDRYSQHDRLILEMPELVFCGPFAMIFLASKISYLKKKCPQLNVIFDGWDRHEYLAHMGFFSMCGFEHGKNMGQAWGNQRYLPITKLNSDSLIEKDFDKYEEMQDLLQRHVDRIAQVLSRGQLENPIMFDVLSYAIREMFRNVFEHSGSQDLYYCAQYWPNSNKVEFAVADFGIGIRRGLGLNPNFRFKSDKEALEYAMLPSVSGRTHEPRRSENWFNSGYGLYMTSRLARNGGNFMIRSGNQAINLTPKTKNNYITSFSGTDLRVNLKADEIGDVQMRLREFRDDGQKIAEKN
ncbi:MAG: hypothetical protein AAGG57_09320 [Pseudomonadota bacterium]